MQVLKILAILALAALTTGCVVAPVPISVSGAGVYRTNHATIGVQAAPMQQAPVYAPPPRVIYAPPPLYVRPPVANIGGVWYMRPYPDGRFPPCANGWGSRPGIGLICPMNYNEEEVAPDILQWVGIEKPTDL